MKKILQILLIGGIWVQTIAQEPAAIQAAPAQEFFNPAISSTAPAQSVAAKPLSSYEQFLDSLDILAKSLLPGRERLVSAKAAISAESPEPKGEYEKQAVYEERAANFEKTKQQRIAKLETDLQQEEKKTIERINLSINSKTDIQPEWAGMLKFDASAEAYNERYEKFANKFREMGGKINGINELLYRLNFDKKSIEPLVKKNGLYLQRLKNACELMQDYVIQDRARILTTEKKKNEMLFGSYDPEKEEFQANISDTASKTTPFIYSGVLKITPEQARLIDRKTDDFTSSVDYINYPFIIDSAKLYLGAKKANVFYKDKEVSTYGIFKGIPNYEKMSGYKDWAVYADSLISGKLVPKKWDSLYAMHPKQIDSNIKPQSNSVPKETFWTGKNVFRAAMFALSAASLGAGLWQNKEAAARTDDANRFYAEGNLDAQRNSIDEFNKCEKHRNIFYAGAGVFGAAGIVSFLF